ncbi:hypothetical protein FRC19_011432 [Serendipita sp. 401]|nr:hypothetical protein FRC19_011432 [Serendipita sp. 401]
MKDRFRSVPILFASNSTHSSIPRWCASSEIGRSCSSSNFFSLFIKSHPLSHLHGEREKEQPPRFSSSSSSADTGASAYPYVCPLAAALLLQCISPLFVLHPNYLTKTSKRNNSQM